MACLGAAPAACQRPAGPPAEILTLDGALALALQHNRTLRISATEEKKYDDKLAAERTRRFPSMSWYALGSQRITGLDFRFARGTFGMFPGVGPVPATDTAIHAPLRPAVLLIGQIAQPLSQQYRIGLGLRALRIGRDIAKEQDRAQRQAIANQVKRSYYGILLTQSALESAEESIKLYREIERLTGDFVAQQAALKSQHLEVRARLAKAQYDALSLRNPLATQKEQLNSLLGREIAVQFSVGPAGDSEWADPDLDASRKMALERRPELKQARLKVEQAEYDRRSKKAEYIPDVSLTVNYLSPVNYGSLVPANIAGVGLLVNWEPFDWGRKKHELAEKDKVVEQARLALRETEDQIMIEVNARFRKLQETRQLMGAVRLAQEAARENLRVMTNRYRQEASLVRDVLQVQASLADADNQYQQALLAFWTARADFEKAIGED